MARETFVVISPEGVFFWGPCVERIAKRVNAHLPAADRVHADGMRRLARNHTRWKTHKGHLCLRVDRHKLKTHPLWRRHNERVEVD
jgi:hypothetical protein